MNAGNLATDFSVALLGALIERGVRDIVVCPGSRSQALALAARAYESAGRVRLRVRIDERVAGFLALGLAAETGRPVVVITTSGTAVANLHPAVLEAHHSGIPLILLTADRPLELRGIGANQTTDQVGIFGSAVSWVREVDAPSAAGFDAEYPEELAHEAYSAAVGQSSAGQSGAEHSGAAGPVQLDLAFREPLSGVVGDLPEAREHWWAEVSPRHPHPLVHAPNTVVIAGNAAGADAEATARALNAPLLAEVSSGARFGPNLVISYRDLLRNEEFGGRVERAIVFGHPTISREIPALLQREGVEFIVVRRRGGEDYNPGHRAAQIVDAVSVDTEPKSEPEARAWVGSWVHRGRELLEVPAPDKDEQPGDLAREQLAAFRESVTRRILAESVWGVTWPHDRLVLGASRLIRELDGVVPGKRISVHSNRGLAGIDGTVSTALGIALASQAEAASQAGTTRVLLGDLTLLHDAGALLFPTGEPRPRIQLIIGNDGGGTIFDTLEVAGVATAEDFDRVQFTPQTANLAALAAAFGWEYVLASNRGELSEALGRTNGQVIIEVPLPR